MKLEKYITRPGDLEIRILADGRLVFVGPDEDMLNLAKLFNPPKKKEEVKLKVKENGRNKTEGNAGR